MVCPVALFADAMTWLFRAGILLMIRLSSAVALAATAFSGVVMLADHLDHYRAGAIAGEPAILSQIVDRPLVGGTHDGPIRIAAVMTTQNERE